MMTSVHLEGVGVAKFECDTAASHSVISKEVFDKLQRLRKHMRSDGICRIELNNGSVDVYYVNTQHVRN